MAKKSLSDLPEHLMLLKQNNIIRKIKDYINTNLNQAKVILIKDNKGN